MPLDSDTPNADAHLTVTFYTSQIKGWEGKPFVRILVPGDQTNVIDQPVREDHKRRFVRQWLHFQSEGSGSPMIGIPLSDWAQECPEDLTEGHLAELQALKFQTVEQLATATDAQIQRLVMGGVGLRIKAQTFIKDRNRKVGSAEVDDLKAQLALQQAQIAELLNRPIDKPRGKPGRKPKIVAELPSHD